MLLNCCSTLGHNVPSSLYDELSVHDADAVMQVDYGANIVGSFITVLLLHLLIFWVLKVGFTSLIVPVKNAQNGKIYRPDLWSHCQPLSDRGWCFQNRHLLFNYKFALLILMSTEFDVNVNFFAIQYQNYCR